MKWLAKLFSGGKKNEPVGLEVLVREYGRVLEAATTVERDISELPYPKDTIRKGMLEAIKITSDIQMRDYLEGGYVSLADFQDLKQLRKEGLSIPNVIVEEAEFLLSDVKALRE